MDIQALITTLRTRYKSLPHHRKTVVTVLGLLFAILIIVILLKYCFVTAKPKEAATPLFIRQGNTIIILQNSPLRTQMVLQTVSTSKTPHTVVLPGIIQADSNRTVNILPPMTGHLVSLNVTIGDEVKKGQVLAVIKSPGLAQAFADESKALSILKQSKEALNRARRVNHAGANAIKDIEQAQSNYAQALAEEKRARATLKSLGNNGSSLLRIQAPISGMVTAVNYGKGSFINDPTASILTLTNIKTVWLTISVPEHLIADVAANQKVQVFLEAYPNQVWQGKISFVSNVLDPATRANATSISFDNPDGKLQPNMFAKVSVEIPQKEQIIVPLSAILMNNDTTSVYVETAPWTFVSRAVELGTEDENQVRILSGLKAGDRIVVSGGIFIND